MIAMDLMRFAVLMSVPAAFALGCISFARDSETDILAAGQNG